MSENNNIDLQEVIEQLSASDNMSPELVEIFSEEAEEHLRTIYEGLDRLRNQSSDMVALGDIRRASHTLKGAAGAVGSEAITRLAHRMEDLLDVLADNQAAASEGQISLLLATADQLEDITTGDFKVESTATTLVGLYTQYESEMQLLAAGNVKTSDEVVAADTVEEDETVVDMDIVATSQADAEEAADQETPIAAVTPDVSAEEVAQQLRAGGSIPEELMEIFGEEAEEHMRTIYDGLDRLRVDSNDAAAFGDIRRSSHTLKGAAGAVGFEAVTRLSHRMEDLLDHLADNKQTVNERQTDLLLATADQLQDLTTTEVDFEKTTETLMGLYTCYQAEMAGLGADAESQTETKTEPVANQDVAAVTAGAAQQETETVEAPVAEKAVVKKTAAPAKEATQYLRVPIDRLDNLVALVGEMIVNRSAFHQRLADLESRIEDMGTALSRFRGVAHDVETRYSVEALKSGTRDAGGMRGARVSSVLSGNEERAGEFDSLEFDRYTEFHLLARTLSEATNDVAVITSEFRTFTVTSIHCLVVNSDSTAMLRTASCTFAWLRLVESPIGWTEPSAACRTNLAKKLS